MAALPDLDDILDQIEGSVASGAQPPAVSRRGFFDPVPCFSTTSNRDVAAALIDAQTGSKKPGFKATTEEEKLSFLEFLKVTAKEAEELQRLHDDTQVSRSTRAAVAEKKQPMTAAAAASAAAPPPYMPPTAVPAAAAAQKWTPSKMIEPEMPELPDVPDTVLQHVQQQNGQSAAAAARRVAAPPMQEMDVDVGEEAMHSPLRSMSPISPSVHVEGEEERAEVGVEMGEEVEEEEHMQQHLLQHPPAPSPAPSSIAVEETELQHVQRELQQLPAASAADELQLQQDADDDFDEVLAYLAKHVGSEHAAPAAAAVAAAAEMEEKEPAAAAAGEAPPSPIAVTPPSCNTAASFDVVSFQALPTEEMGETEMERELEEVARDFPDSDQPELAREEEEGMNATGDETFFSAVESLDRTEVEEEEEEKMPDHCSEVPTVVIEREEEEEGEKKGERTIGDSPILISPSISGESAVSMEMLEKEEADEMHPTVEAPQDEEVTVVEEAPIDTREDTVAASPERMEEIDTVEDTVSSSPGPATMDEDTVAAEEQSIDTVEDTVAMDTVEEESIDYSIPEVAENGEQAPEEFAELEDASESANENREEEGEMGNEEEEQDAAAAAEGQEEEVEDAAAAAAAAARAARFRDRVISDVHEIDGDEAPAGRVRLTESERQLGKTPPIWIPDAECATCMLCSARFTFLLRRHHCRACGRVLCGACCNERTVLAYQPDKGKARVCSPCAGTLARVEEWERQREGASDPTASGDAAAAGGEGGEEGEGAAAAAGAAEGGVQQPSSEFTSASMRKSILKVRAASVTSEEQQLQHSQALSIPARGGGEEGGGGSAAGSFVGSAPRGVVFRDGSKPGEHTAAGEEEEGRTERVQAKPSLRKKSRKRAAVSRRVAALKVEEQLASALPTHSRPELLIEQKVGVRCWQSLRECELALAAGDCLRVAVNRLLTVNVKICEAPYGEGRVMAAVSQGFHGLGLDEIVFCWRFNPSQSLREDDEEMAEEEEGEGGMRRRMRAEMPMGVLRRMEEMLQACFASADLADVRRVALRMPRVHTSISGDCEDEGGVLMRHTMMVPVTFQSTRHLPLLPSVPYSFAQPIHQEELQWALAAPNRVLMRLGLKSGCYPTPLIIEPGRAAVYSEESSGSVLKMFNDMSAWTYRMQHVVGGTVALSNEETVVRIPRYARQQMRKIVEVNRNMLAWLCDVNMEADSHLVCLETEGGLGPYESNIFQKGEERSKTGATFIIIDGALKTPAARVQVSVCEDGVAVRLPSEGLVELINALLDGKDHTVEGESHRLRVRWAEPEEELQAGSCSNCSSSATLRSPIDGTLLADKMQYGITLERAISSAIPAATVFDTATRLSHVFNMKEGLLPREDEAKVYSIAEVVACEAGSILEEFYTEVMAMGIETIAIRMTIERDRIEYEVGEWAGLEELQAKYKENMDRNLIPLFAHIFEYVKHGFVVELWINIFNTVPLPVEIC